MHTHERKYSKGNSGNQSESAGNAGGAWLSSTIAVQVWLATKGWRLDGTTRPWAFLSLPGIRVGALALYHNQMCIEHLY